MEKEKDKPKVDEAQIEEIKKQREKSVRENETVRK